MAVYVEEVSRTFGEYLLIPGLTTKQCVPSNVSLRTPLVKHAAGTQAAIELNIPFVSAVCMIGYFIIGVLQAVGLTQFSLLALPVCIVLLVAILFVIREKTGGKEEI